VEAQFGVHVKIAPPVDEVFEDGMGRFEHESLLGGMGAV
jgi:hypothetical protein